MTFRSVRRRVFLAAGFCSTFAWGGAQAPARPLSLVRQIDHVLLSSNHPKELFALFADTFQLPVAWPLSEYGGFTSGGVALGNVNLEILRAREPLGASAEGRVVGVALEPEPLQVCLPELDRRQISHGSPAPFRSRKLTDAFKVRWTTVALPELSKDNLEVFFCDYSHDQAARRQGLRQQLRSQGGGPLSILSVREIVCGAQDPNACSAQWQKLLDLRAAPTSSLWPIGTGPALRIVRAERDGIQELTVTLTSLDQARRFLQEHALLGPDRLDGPTVSSPLLRGVVLRLVEQPLEPPRDSTLR